MFTGAWFGEFLRRLQFRLNGTRFDRDLAEEMQLHMDLRASEKRIGATSPEDARAAARRQFGNPVSLQEASREAWGWTFVDTLVQDLRYGCRALSDQPGFTATAVLSLALGIGANTAIFGVINAVMLRSLPVEDPQALVQLRLGTGGDDEVSTPIWEQIRDNQQAFSGVLAYSPDRFNLADSGQVQYAQGMWVSGDFFRVLGVPALAGRAFTPADDRWGGGSDGAVAVISHSFWKSHWNGNPDVIGKVLRLNRQSFVVVGVTPPWFTGLNVDRGFDVAIPIGCQPIFRDGNEQVDEAFHWWLRVVGRLGPGSTLKLAEQQMHAIGPQILLPSLPPGQNAKEKAEYLNARISLQPAGLGFSQTRVQYRFALYTLMSIVGAVLLIACANIANLLLARGSARQRELSVRMAIGASRGRVVRQLMTESLLLSGMGAGVGLLFAMWGSRVLLQLLSTARNPVDIPISPDIRLLAFTTLVAGLTALLFGLAPALRSTRFGLNAVLKENQRGTVSATSLFTGGNLLVVGQIALSVVLLAGAGLFINTLRNLLSVDTGFDRRNVLLMNAGLPQDTTPQQRMQTYRTTLSRLQEIPGVISAASSVLTPISPEGWAQPVYPDGVTGESPRDTLAFLNRVSTGYFRTMRTPLIAGREFQQRDTLHAPRVVLINETTARDFFGDVNPLGRTIGMDKPGDVANPGKMPQELYQVIGVVKDTKYNRIDEKPRRIVYLAGEQDPQPGSSLRFLMLAATPAEALVPAIHAALSEGGQNISLEFRTLEAQVNDSLLQPGLVAILSSVFGAVALLLAMLGLYGITAYSVTRRKNEIGLRIALGARPQAVVWLILRDVAILLAVGLVAGSAASVAAGRVVSSLLYGIPPNATGPLVTAALILAVSAAIAASVPAGRAARLDPMTALREE
ncbi:MAG: ABC transporter permease [Bryobacteraceae bacterium]|nr:ABC transporter permease [Bryobacteraceae bacterium]